MGLIEGFDKFEISNVLAIDCSDENIFLFSSLKLRIKVKQMNRKKVIQIIILFCFNYF